MSTVGEMGKALEGALEAVGRMEQEEAKQWLTDNFEADGEITIKDLNLALGFGTNPSRKWWSKEGDELVYTDPEDRQVKKAAEPAETPEPPYKSGRCP